MNIDINMPTRDAKAEELPRLQCTFQQSDIVLSKSAADPKNSFKTYLKKNAIPRVEKLATDSTEVTFLIGWGENNKNE